MKLPLTYYRHSYPIIVYKGLEYTLDSIWVTELGKVMMTLERDNTFLNLPMCQIDEFVDLSKSERSEMEAKINTY
jgi:hypothetical protein